MPGTEPENYRRIETSADIADNRNIASQATLHRLFEQPFELVDQGAWIGQPALGSGVGKIQVPVFLDLNSAVADLEVMAGGEGLDSLEEGSGRPRAEKVEEVVDPFWVGDRPHQPRGEQRLDFGTPEEPAIALGVVERADAHAVAPKDQGTVRPVPKRDRELAARLLKHPLAEVFVKMDPCLGVATGCELVAACQEIAAKFGIFEEFAVERDPDGFILVADWLPAAGEVDDR